MLNSPRGMVSSFKPRSRTDVRTNVLLPGQRLRSLPIQVKYYRYETISSYELRLAVANHLDIADLKAASKLSQPVTSPFVRRRPEYLDTLAQLGNLKNSPIFSEPECDGFEIRRMCPRCAHGDLVWLKDPTSGYVCLKHSIWLASQTPIAFAPNSQITHAEERVRKVLAVEQRKLLGTSVYRFFEKLALTCLSEDELEQRQTAVEVHETSLVIYPETVVFLEVLTDPCLVDKIDPRRISRSERYDYLDTLPLPKAEGEQLLRVQSLLRRYSDRIWQFDFGT